VDKRAKKNVLRTMDGHARPQQRSPEMRRLRQEPWGRTLMLMAITGWGQQEDKERAKAAGFDRHFTKPVDPDDVEGALHALLDHRQSE
jgi:CheY-like chemotaxis protein